MPPPNKKETLKEYAVRFMADPAMVKKYPNEKQRYIVMLSHWQDRLEKMVLLKHLIKIRQIYKAARDKYDRMAMKLANQMLGVWDEQTKLAIADTIRSIKGTGPYKKTGPITQAEMKRKLDDISQMMGEDIIGKMRDPVNRFTEEIYFGELTEMLGTGAAFNVIDERAIAWAEKNSMYWIGEYYGTMQSKQIGGIAANVLKRGMDRNAAALFLLKELGKQFKRSHSYWDLLSNHVVTRSREFGRTSAYQKAEIKYLRISAVIDHRTSLICRSLNGKIIPVSWNIALRDKLINSKNPEDVKKISPWMKDKEIEKKIVGKKVKDMPKHVGMPPYHARCRTRTVKATQVQWEKQD
jgi:SPP1 gp7 family putative phage head morphogenesis protein